MKKDHLNWYIVNKNYINYLKQYDSFVQNIDYRDDIKPYIGIILQVNNFNYYVPISSVKAKHYHMKESRDLVIIKKNEKILGVLNLNNMVPILAKEISILKYDEINQFKTFSSLKDQANYIGLLNQELNIINKRKSDILLKAKKLYNERINYPQSAVSKRCCDFKLLEEKCVEYMKEYDLDD